MKKLLVGLIVVFSCVCVDAQSRTSQSTTIKSYNTPNGGQRYMQGTTYLGRSQPNAFKGQNYYNGQGRLSAQSFPTATGYRYRDWKQIGRAHV